jgi:hypothetical protein
MRKVSTCEPVDTWLTVTQKQKAYIHVSLCFLVGPAGLEPATKGL